MIMSEKKEKKKLLEYLLKISRDHPSNTVSAEEIAQTFGWEYKHYPLTPEVLERNIILTAERGAEYSPVHLHCREDISKTKGLDGILAGTYS